MTKMNNYTATVGSVSSLFKQEKSFSNRLNWIVRHFSDYEKESLKRLEDVDTKKRIQGYCVVNMAKFALGNFRSQMWKKCLGEKDQKRLDLFDETNGNKGGISVFRILQITYGVAYLWIKKHQTANFVIPTKKSDIEALETEFITLAEHYHANAKIQAEKRQAEKETKSEDSAIEATIKQLQEETITVRDIDSIEMLQLAHKNKNTNATLKGRITKRIKALKALNS